MGDNKWSHLRKQKNKERKALIDDYQREQDSDSYGDRKTKNNGNKKAGY